MRRGALSCLLLRATADADENLQASQLSAPSPSKKWSTLETVRLKATTVKPMKLSGRPQTRAPFTLSLTVISNVEDQVLSHDSKTDEAEIFPESQLRGFSGQPSLLLLL